MELGCGCPHWFIPGVPLGLLTWLSVAWPLLCRVSYPAISSQTLAGTVSFPCHQMSGYLLLHVNERKRGQMKRNYRKTGASFPACNTMRQTSIVSSAVRTATTHQLLAAEKISFEKCCNFVNHVTCLSLLIISLLSSFFLRKLISLSSHSDKQAPFQ